MKESMKVKELIELLEKIENKESTIIIGFDSNLGEAFPNGRYEFRKYVNEDILFLFSDS